MSAGAAALSPELDLMIVCETPRLLLREWTLDDGEAFRPLGMDPRVLRYIGTGTLWTEQQIRERIARWIELSRERGWILWAVVHRADAALIGFCGFSDGFPPDVEIGWRLRVEYWGQGLATEAATAVLALGFNRWAFPRVISVAHVENQASIRVMQKLGMQQERTFQHNGVDVVCYAKYRQDDAQNLDSPSRGQSP